jgi:hypothetical protein
MQTLISFNFLAILNLFVIVLWPASGYYSGTRNNILGIIMVILTIILTIITVVLDIVYMVIALVR